MDGPGAARYHRAVIPKLAEVISWTRAILVAGLPWLARWRPEIAAAAVALAVLGGRGPLPADPRWPWRPGLVLLSAVSFLALRVSPAAAAAWIGAALAVWLVARLAPPRGGRRPDAAEGAGVLLWAGLQLAWPAAGGALGWLAGGLALGAARLVARELAGASGRASAGQGPPSRELRGTVSLRGLVLAGGDGLPRSVPLELEMRAGDSVAVLCDATADGEALAATFAGRRAPAGGEVSIDGVPIEPGERVVAVVAPGEPFVPGSLETNLAVLAGAPLSPAAAAAVREACGLAEVADALGGRQLGPDGEPLGSFHRMLVLVARVVPSHYRVLVVQDPMPWVNAVRGELWRTAVVRASVGRTALWVTPDRALAARADVVLALRGGGLRPVAAESLEGRTG